MDETVRPGMGGSNVSYESWDIMVEGLSLYDHMQHSSHLLDKQVKEYRQGRRPTT